MQNSRFDEGRIGQIRSEVMKMYDIGNEDAGYFVFSDVARNSAYDPVNDRINILFRDGTVQDITEASDQLNVQVLSKTVTKFFLCYPKKINVS